MAARLRDLPSQFGEHFLPYKPSLRQRIQGRRFANESYVASVQLFYGREGSLDIKSSVFHSQRKSEKPHKINMAVGKDSITDCHCSCKAGVTGECAHILGVILKLTDWLTEGLLDVPSQPACTSLPQQWDKPRGVKICSEPVSAVILSRSGITGRKKRPITPVFRDNRKVQLLDSDIELLQSMRNTPLGYLATKPFGCSETLHGPQYISSTLSHQLQLIEPIYEPSAISFPCATDWEFPAEPEIRNLDIVEDYMTHFDKVKLTKERAIYIEQNTRDQAGSALWKNERKIRLTASNFGKIMNRKSAVTQKCVNSIINSKEFSSVATGYGQDKETIAKILYQKSTKNHVHPCGLMVNPRFPCIAATPDGKVCTDGQTGILEIKCPFWCKDMKIKTALEKAMAENRDFHIVENNGRMELKKGHNYWWQVQGQLLVSGAKWCDLFTYTKVDSETIKVIPDQDAMESLLSKLCSVYSKFMQ